MFTRALLAALLALTAASFTHAAPPAAAAAAQHGQAWSSLAALKGKYFADKPASRVLVPVLKKLLGKEYAAFDNANGVQSPLALQQGVLLGYGMQPHSGGDVATVYALAESGGVLVLIKQEGGKLRQFGDDSLLTHPAVQKALAELKAS